MSDNRVPLTRLGPCQAAGDGQNNYDFVDLTQDSDKESDSGRVRIEDDDDMIEICSDEEDEDDDESDNRDEEEEEVSASEEEADENNDLEIIENERPGDEPATQPLEAGEYPSEQPKDLAGDGSDEAGPSSGIKRRAEDSPDGKKKSKVESKVFDVDELVQTYLNVFNTKKLSEDYLKQSADNLKALVESLKVNKPKYLKCKEFSVLIEWTAETVNLEEDKERIKMLHKDLLLELDRINHKKDKKENEEGEKNGKLTDKDRAKIQKRINDLTKQIKIFSYRIAKAEQEVLSMDQMNQEDTGYVNTPKLIKKLLQLWTEREKLLNRSTRSGRSLVEKFTLPRPTNYVEINKAIEKEATKFFEKIADLSTKTFKDEEFSIIEVKKIIETAVKKHNLVVPTVDLMAADVYEQIRKEFKSRRDKDIEDVFDSYANLEDLLPDQFVNPKLQLLEKDLALNKSACEKRMNEIIAKYCEEDKRVNGEELSTDSGEPEWNKEMVGNEQFEVIVGKEEDLTSDSELEELEQDETTEANGKEASEAKDASEANGKVANEENGKEANEENGKEATEANGTGASEANGKEDVEIVEITN